jgi:hypothetical protein
MYIIKKGAPVQRMTSDGFPFTDRTDGRSETADVELELFPEAVLLTPEHNNGKWLFVLGSGQQWQVDPKYVQIGRQRSFHVPV